jgi:hypothetical protein
LEHTTDKHIVPYGTIPWTQDKSGKIVSFLNKHTVMVIDKGVCYGYNINPQYEFGGIAACEKFMSILRDRDLQGAFDTVKILLDRMLVSNRQVVRFWERKKHDATRLVTMTFLQSCIGDSRQHKEIDVGKLRRTAEFQVWKVLRGTESKILKICATPPKAMPDIQIQFQTIGGE